MDVLAAPRFVAVASSPYALSNDAVSPGFLPRSASCSSGSGVSSPMREVAGVASSARRLRRAYAISIIAKSPSSRPRSVSTDDRAGLIAQPLDHRVDVGVGDFDLRIVDLEAAVLAQLDLRLDLELAPCTSSARLR